MESLPFALVSYYDEPCPGQTVQARGKLTATHIPTGEGGLVCRLQRLKDGSGSGTFIELEVNSGIRGGRTKSSRRN